MRNRITHALRIVGQAVASAAALSTLAGSIAVSAQAPQTSRTAPANPSSVDDRVTFEVASIRPVDPRSLPAGLPGLQGPCGGAFELTSGRIRITAAQVYRLIAAAYGIPCVPANNLGLISGGPDWVHKEVF